MRGISALIIVVIVVIAIVVVGVGVYVATRGSKSSPSTSATPTPTSRLQHQQLHLPQPQLSKIATATSYEFNETGTASNGTVLDTLFYATKNLGTSNVDLYEAVTSPSSGTLIYIINGGEQKAWVYQDGQWTDISTDFSSISSSVQSTAGLYVNMPKNTTAVPEASLIPYRADNQTQETKLRSQISKLTLHFRTLCFKDPLDQ